MFIFIFQIPAFSQTGSTQHTVNTTKTIYKIVLFSKKHFSTSFNEHINTHFVTAVWEQRTMNFLNVDNGKFIKYVLRM